MAENQVNSAPDFIPDADMKSAGNAPGFIPDDQFVSDEDKHGTPLEMFKTGIEGIAQGALGPIATAMEKKAGKSEEVSARAEANPITHGVSKLVGFVAGPEARAVSAVSSIFRNPIARGVMENILVAGGDETSKLMVNDPKQSAESALSHLGLAAVIGGSLGKLGSSVNKLAEGKTGKFLEEFKDRISQHMETGAQTAPIGNGAKLADSLVSDGAKKLSGEGLGATAGSIIGSTVGHPFVGAYVGKKYLGPQLESVIPTIARNLLQNPTSAAAFNSAAKYATAVAKGQTLLNKAADGVFKLGSDIFSSPESSEKLSKSLDGLDQSPEQLLKSAEPLAHYMPEHASIVSETLGRVTTYLSSVKPNTDKISPLQPSRVPSAVEEGQYKQALDIAENPLIIANKIKEGSLTPADMTAMYSMYPSLAEGFKAKLIGSMTNHLSKGESIPYKTAMSLSLFLSQPLESSTLPQNIMANQMQTEPAHVPSEPDKKASSAKGGVSEAKANGLNKISKTNQSGPQAREAQKQSRNSK